MSTMYSEEGLVPYGLQNHLCTPRTSLMCT